jgi:hypothetical protein
MRHVATLGVPPPDDPRDRVESGVFLCTLLLRCLVVSLVLWAVVAAVTDLPVWWLILGSVTTLALACDVPWLTYRVHRDRRRRTS